MKIYFTRHGKTQWNKEHRLQGMHGDSPLLPESYQAIHLLGKYLEDVSFTKIYSSTLQRAKDTAQGIENELKQSTEIIYDPNLREIGFGKIEGHNFDHLAHDYKEQMYDLRHQLDQYDPSAYQGETVDQVIERMTETIFKAIEENKGPLLFVGHGASLTMTIQHLIGKSPNQYRAMGGLDNNSLTVLETQNETLPFQLVKWNDSHFLSDLEKIKA
ncbi:MAG TPA: histidine phosphatase family protein [Candidatus Tetragenococcus pullicola]|nr:histidine phosphatase family protein [Candidatus Tetragenococcus pullicola]